MRLRSSWTEHDLLSVREAISAKYPETQATGKQWTRSIDPIQVYTAVAEGQVGAVLYDGYMVVFDVGVPWYNASIKVLQELLVLRVEPSPGNFRSVLKVLDILCAAYECDCIVVGDALQDASRLKRVYVRGGYTEQAHQLMKGKPAWVE